MINLNELPSNIRMHTGSEAITRVVHWLAAVSSSLHEAINSALTSAEIVNGRKEEDQTRSDLLNQIATAVTDELIQSGAIEAALSRVFANTVTDADRRAIRTLWIEDRRESYPIDFLAKVLHVSNDRVENASLDLNADGELDREDVLILTTQFYSASQIEDALGAEASMVLPPGRLTRLVTLRLSAWVFERFRRRIKSVRRWPTISGDRWSSRDHNVDSLIDEELADEADSREYNDDTDDYPPLEIDAAAMTAAENRRCTWH